MKVVFIENVPSVANAGDVKEVKDGYGRNYLFPRKLAMPATAAALVPPLLLAPTAVRANGIIHLTTAHHGPPAANPAASRFFMDSRQ